jgi:tetratricopeptide (TPR) repeat protein
VESIQVPATVQAVLAARIDRLSPEEKRLLQSAAVIGERVPFTLLQAVVGMSEEELRRGLAYLQGAEFLYEASLFPELEYTFKHGLTYQVAYNSLLQDRRRGLHARIVGAIETLYHDRLTEQVERLAHHAFRGELWDKAVAYLRQAGARAAARWAHREAVGYLEQAMEALQRLPQARETIEQDVEVRLDLRPSLYELGDPPERIIRHLREAESLAENLGDQRRLLRVTSDMTAYFYGVGDHVRAVESGERALSSATSLGDFALQVQINNRLGRANVFLGNYRRAIGFWRWTIGSLKGKLLHERFGMAAFQGATSRAFLALCLAELGEFDEGIGPGEEAIHIAEEVNHPHTITVAYGFVGYLYLVKGDLPRAILLLEHAVDVCRIKQVPAIFPRVASCLGYAYLHSGPFAEALPLLEEAVGKAASTQFIAWQSLQIAWLSEAYLRAGKMDEAVKSAGCALDLSRQHKERGHQAYALRLFGEIAAHKNPPDVQEAENHYGQAIALAKELDMRPLIAQCNLGLGKLCRRMGKQHQAKEYLTTATAMMREMEMGLWLL